MLDGHLVLHCEREKEHDSACRVSELTTVKLSHFVARGAEVAIVARREAHLRRGGALGLPNFIGAFIGMACQDMGSTGTAADFDWFAYRERAFEADPTIS
jgi:hypothetical protein